MRVAADPYQLAGRQVLDLVEHEPLAPDHPTAPDEEHLHRRLEVPQSSRRKPKIDYAGSALIVLSVPMPLLAGGGPFGGPGGGPTDYAAFYSYAYPAPEGFSERPVQPAEAFFHAEAGEFILPYEAVRTAPDSEAALTAFLESTYAAAADLAGWDRAALERRR